MRRKYPRIIRKRIIINNVQNASRILKWLQRKLWKQQDSENYPKEKVLYLIGHYILEWINVLKQGNLCAPNPLNYLPLPSSWQDKKSHIHILIKDQKKYGNINL